ncbi:MAG: phage tail length tape measure family protein, partial [Candidatus Limnocylindrus sp.]
MAKRNAVLNIIFGADTKELDKALQGVAKRLRSTADDLTGLGKSLSVGLTAPIVAFGALATKNAVDSAKAIAQVEAAVKSTGGAAGRSVDQLAEMAEGLQRISLYDDDEILKQVTANLLTFTKVTGTEFDKAQVAILNLSTRLGTDLTSATVQVGKALNDPIKGVTALGRAGVQFTAQQKEQIEALVEAGDVAAAQTIILGELETQFGGASEAAANVDPYTQLANEIGNLSEDFGAIINDAIKPLVHFVRQAVDAIKGWSDETKATVLVVGGLLAVLGPTLIAVGSLINAYVTIKGALIAARAAQIGLNLATLANPYVLAAAAVVTLTVAIYNMNRRATDAATQVNKLAEAVDQLSATEAIAEVNRAILEQTRKVRELESTYETLQKQREGGDQFDRRIASQRKQ